MPPCLPEYWGKGLATEALPPGVLGKRAGDRGGEGGQAIRLRHVRVRAARLRTAGCEPALHPGAGWAAGKNSLRPSVGTFEVATPPSHGPEDADRRAGDWLKGGKQGAWPDPFRCPPVCGSDLSVDGNAHPPATAGASVVTVYAACELPAAAKSTQNRAIPASTEGWLVLARTLPQERESSAGPV
jgi:hypothetical protein